METSGQITAPSLDGLLALTRETEHWLGTLCSVARNTRVGALAVAQRRRIEEGGAYFEVAGSDFFLAWREVSSLIHRARPAHEPASVAPELAQACDEAEALVPVAIALIQRWLANDPLDADERRKLPGLLARLQQLLRVVVIHEPACQHAAASLSLDMQHTPALARVLSAAADGRRDSRRWKNKRSSFHATGDSGDDAP